jgi:hypothetical protein
LGLNTQFLNSLRLAWSLGLMVDAAVLLRTLALLTEISWLRGDFQFFTGRH